LIRLQNESDLRSCDVTYTISLTCPKEMETDEL